MIFTVTTSPSLDLVMDLSGQVRPGKTLRAVREELRPGGKGINISIMLKNLGVTSTALGFVAGFSGDELMRLTTAAGIQTGFIRVRRGRTRINLRLKAQSVSDLHQETRINGLGPIITPDDINYLVRKVSALKTGDFLVLAGTVPPSLPQDIYTTFFKALDQKKVDVIVDAPAELLHAVLRYHPFLIKPNLDELKGYLNKELSTTAEIIKAAHYLQKEGAQNVLVSMGSFGAVFVNNDGRELILRAPGGVAVDKTGAGDSMVAGFLASYIKHHDLKLAAKLAVAAGSATALSNGIARQDTVLELYEQMAPLAGTELQPLAD